MKIFQRHTLLVLSALVLTFNGCIKQEDFDFNKVTSGEWSPEFAIPLIHSDLSIGDITGASNGMLSVNNNHQVTLVYSSNIYSKYGYEFFTPVNQSNAQTLMITYSDSSTLYQDGSLTRSVSRVMPLTFPNGEQIDSLTFRKGDLRINITSEIPHGGVLNISIPEATKNGLPFTKDVPFTEFTVQTIYAQDIADLSGYNMKTNIGGMPNQLNIVYTLTFNNSNSSLNTLNKNFDITTSFDAMTPASLFGYFGQSEFIMPLDSLNLNVFNNIQAGSIYFDDPKMTLSLENSFGMPLDAVLNPLTAILGNGTSIPLSGPIPTPLIDYPLTYGQTATTNIVFDKNNSNIQQIINSAPRYFAYGLDAGTNSPLPTYNFMSDSSVFKADVKFEIPLKGYASGFVIQDTIDFSIGDINELESVIFRLNVANGFPLNVYTQVYFVDDNYNVLDSLIDHFQNRLIESAELESDGRTTIPTKRMTDESFKGAKLQHLFNAKKVIIHGDITTKDAPFSMIEIYDDYKLDFKLGVRTKLRVDL